MRPESLFPYFAPVTALPGIGARTGRLIEKLTGPYVIDLLWHLPRELTDRRYNPKIAEAKAGVIATLTVEIVKHIPPFDRKKRPYRITCRDETGEITVIFFRGDEKWLSGQMPEGSIRVISGKLEAYGNSLQMPHPDFIVPHARLDEIPKIEAIYPLTGGLTPKIVYKAVQGSLKRVQQLPEWLDAKYLKRQGWQPWCMALQTAHNPQSQADLLPTSKARERLAFDELLANQLALGIMRQQIKKQSGRMISGTGNFRSKLLTALPFKMTGSQEQALEEIYEDMAAPTRMLRLLQGDVGSGKTVVALFAMLNAIECGGQAVLMAPTEILARQHFETIKPLADTLDITSCLLTGRDKGKARSAILDKLYKGETSIIIGTHALFQEDVKYKELMIAIIDEQHRFGVHQRLTLAQKGKGIDMLVMTATPIPRTLMMTAYGDLDGSRLNEKPEGRKPIKTVVISNDRLDEVVNSVGRKIQEGAKVYWVCPLVEESDILDMTAAEERYRELSGRFGENQVSLVHGKMKSKEKDAAMAHFASGDAKLLIATTVIEVGVNVPAATVMVIEHAERFGLAQLHQLRGRIGRGNAQSTCLLLRTQSLSETARERLKVISQTNDGFIIAEKDLELRGAGEILGTRQSGLPDMRLADFALHGELMRAAADDAQLILSRDPALTSDRGKALRTLLYLFERDSAVANLRSG